jgi:formylglycine-generating enzyme required for sulfatase activity
MIAICLVSAILGSGEYPDPYNSSGISVIVESMPGSEMDKITIRWLCSPDSLVTIDLYQNGQYVGHLVEGVSVSDACLKYGEPCWMGPIRSTWSRDSGFTVRILDASGSFWLSDSFRIQHDLEISSGMLTSAEYIAALEGLGMSFVQIPSGSFLMGSEVTEDGHLQSEAPIHRVEVESFDLLSTEVTQGMWEFVMGGNPSYFAGDHSRPVESVSWDDCEAFIDSLNAHDSIYLYRLPAEAEWEYVCRAGTTTAYFTGNSPYGLSDYCWHDEYVNARTHEVGWKLPNDWGLYDMSGNVREWCEDWFHPSYAGAPNDGSAWLSPSSERHVYRGGGFGDSSENCRSAARGESYYPDPNGPRMDLGFRLARSARPASVHRSTGNFTP